MKIFYLLMLTATLSLLAIFGCSKESNTLAPDNSSGALKIHLTDSPGGFDAVNITFSKIEVHRSTDIDTTSSDSASSNSSGWNVINNQEQTFDLLSLSNGVTALLGEKQLEAGHYTQIRITIKSAEAVVNSELHDVIVPSGTLKLVSSFVIEKNATTELILDFDVSRSVHKTGGKNSKYMLKSTVRIIGKPLCGSIDGKVLNFADAPVAYAIAGTDTVSGTIVNKQNGNFTLGFINPGTYTVSISDTLNKNYTQPSVIVFKGVITDLGFVTLE